ncbi:transposase [Deinococcus malanensis]|uniref:transposase n=1 Tax=Deinococcus malanensis TaxID=1706855 RepID=UPI00363B18AB
MYVSGCPPLERFTRTTSRFPARRSGRSRWPGYGFVTAVSVLAETRGFHGLHSSRQLSAYAGIAPTPNQSGAMSGRTPISKTGNEHLRRTAYLAAIGAMKCKGPLGQYYRQLRTRGSQQKSPWWPLAGSYSASGLQSSPLDCRTTRSSKASEWRL